MKIHEILLLKCHTDVISVYSDPSPIATKYSSFNCCVWYEDEDENVMIQIDHNCFWIWFEKLFTYSSGFAGGQLANPEQKL